MIIGIVAISKNFAIGRGGKLPWHFKSDLKFFKSQTLHHACLMGSRTWASLDRPLSDRINIVLGTKPRTSSAFGALCAYSVETVLELNSVLKCDLYVIGGSGVYNSMAEHIEKWVVSYIPLRIEDADVYMPEDFLSGFKEVESAGLEDGVMVKKFIRA